MEKICILIPAYNPDERLMRLYRGIRECLPQCRIIIVNDGSSSATVFSDLSLKCPPPDRILNHSVNLGKGEALKDGFKYILDNFPDCIGIVTADCDLQHSPEDIAQIVHQLSNNPTNLYLGSRFSSHSQVPFRSSIGNKLTSFFMKILHDIDLKDTQTGLRGIPNSFARELLTIKVSDFSFETEMLIEAKKCNVQINEIPIQTIYIDNNKHSHFKPIKDSYKICKSLLKK